MLNPDYRDLLSAFANSQVEFVLVGAYAMAAHGQPRATLDIDLLVRPTDQNVARIVAALREFGAPEPSIDANALRTPGMVVQIGVAPRRIDLLTRLSGVATDAAFAHALPIDVEGLRIPVLAVEDLIANKRATGRAQDRLDADRLEALLRRT